MTQQFSLNRLLEIAASSAKSAAASLGTLNRQLQQHEEKLLVLVKYRTEYQERLRHTTGNGVDAAGLRNFIDFLERLEQAILQQRALVADARTRVACGRSDWQLKQRKSKAFDTLAQRFEVSVQRKQANHEQKVQDDFASRASRDKQHAHGRAPLTATKNRR